ncbi:hypothetical protein EVC24_056 [Rhizobium phage RHph_I4]|nr:hypothetical protein EVC24_056 [Rhizobium phage RHph_I4]
MWETVYNSFLVLAAVYGCWQFSKCVAEGLTTEEQLVKKAEPVLHSWSAADAILHNEEPSRVHDRTEKPEPVWSDDLGRWVLPGDIGRQARLTEYSGQVGAVRSTVENNLVLIYSNNEPPDDFPKPLRSAAGVLWVMAEQGSMRCAAWDMDADGKWHEIGDRKYGTVKHALLQRNSTLLGITAVSQMGMSKFAQVVQSRSKEGNVAKSQLPKNWIEWMDKLEPEAQDAVCELLSITNDIRREQGAEARRRVDLDD